MPLICLQTIVLQAFKTKFSDGLLLAITVGSTEAITVVYTGAPIAVFTNAITDAGTDTSADVLLTLLQMVLLVPSLSFLSYHLYSYRCYR